MNNNNLIFKKEIAYLQQIFLVCIASILLLGNANSWANTANFNVSSVNSFTVNSSHGTIDGAGIILNDIADCRILAGEHYYASQKFTLSSTVSSQVIETIAPTTINYVGGSPDDDTHIALYSPSFSSSNPQTNLVSCNDDTVGFLSKITSTNLAAGSYEIVITTFGNGGATSGLVSGGNITLSFSPDVTLGTATAANIPSLVINEIDYDNVGTDGAEFVEIKNISGSAINLSGYTVEFINDATDTAYRTIALPTISLAANDYYVICSNNSTVANCDLDSTPNTNFIQNGTPDIARIIQGSFVVDTVSYGGTATPAIYVETTGTTAEDSNSEPLVSLSRYSDGTDTQNNSLDFALKCITPGTANNVNANNGCYTLSINDPSAVNEGDTGTTTLTFTVTLSHATTSNVTVNYATANDTATAGSDYTSASGTLTFAAGETSKTISITVTGDQIDESNETFKVNLTSPSNNAQLSATSGATEGIGTIIDDDTAGFTLSKTTAFVNESGTTDTFTVILDSQPTSNVEISVSSDNTSEATVSPAILTFTTSNWNTAQTVTITGVDDGAVSDGNQNSTVTLSVVDANSDNTYDSLADKTVTVTTVDNDTPGITVTPTTLTVSEPSGTATFVIKLNTQPSSDVSVSVVASSACNSSVSSATITNANWNTGTTITVTANDDNIINGSSRTCTITIGNSTSSDANYNNVNPNDVTVTVTDNDTAGISGIGGSVNATEGGSKGTYSLTLNTQPTGNVEITVTANAQTEVSNDGTTFGNTAIFTFTNGNWNTAQTVTVKAIDDATVEGSHTATITHTITGTPTDANYPTALTLGNVTVNIADNDQASSIGSTNSPNYTVIVQTTGTGTGRVEQTAISSTGSAAQIKLEAMADVGSQFTGWSERFAPECVGSNPIVTVTINAIKTCIATFEKIPLKIQTINFTPLTAKQFGDPDFSLQATATSGLTVTFESHTPTICTVTQNTVQFKNSGICNIVAQQLGDNQYVAATPVSQSFNIMPKTSNNTNHGTITGGNGSEVVSQLRGISANGYVDQQPLIVGLFSGGKQRVLIRASGVFQDINPKITVLTYPDRTFLASNDDWKTTPNAVELQQKQLAPARQTDAGMLIELPKGLLTVEMTASIAGVGLVEIYDLGVFENFSATNYAFKGFSVNTVLNDYPIIAGLLVTGDKKPMLLRASALEDGVDPELELFSYPDRRLLTTNYRWTTSAAQSELQQKQLIPPHETDAATLIDLSKGLFTIEVIKAPNSQSGRSIVEIYEMTAFH